MSERRIVKVEHTEQQATVFLDDGSELKGLIEVSTVSTVNQLSTVSLQAYVFPYEPAVQYVHEDSDREISLTEAQARHFFGETNEH